MSKLENINYKDNITYYLIKKYILSIISFVIIILLFVYLLRNNYSINEQAYFYTLSTIPQTLAALIGLIGIFVVFRLQILHSRDVDHLRNLRDLISKGGAMKAHPFTKLDHHDNDETLFETANKIFEKSMKETKDLSEGVVEFHRIVSDLRKNKSDLIYYKESFLFPILIGTFGILISIISLPFGHILLPDNVIYYPSFPFIAIGLSLAFTIAAIVAIIDSLVELLMYTTKY